MFILTVMIVKVKIQNRISWEQKIEGDAADC